MSSVYVENFGCRATQADGAALERQFRQRGFDCAAEASKADWVVLNTCAVTAAAEQDARAAIRRVRRANPACKIVVTGCYAQRAPEEIAALPGVSHVVGNSHKNHLVDLVTRGRLRCKTSADTSFLPVAQLTAPLENVPEWDKPEIFVSDIFAHTELLAAPVFDSANHRVRPNLKVQDGCNNRCSFCIIPYLRGRSRSLKLDEALRQVNDLVNAGYREIVISGINLGRWGRDFRTEEKAGSSFLWGEKPSIGPRFEDLLRAILEHSTIEKLRISSVEPMDWSESLIALVADSPRIAKHAHVPLQSGSDTVLRRMHRKYRPWHYREKIERIRAAIPSAAIGADVMVGFPGESDREFEETYRMIEVLPLTYLHVFTFSARPGTPAATLPQPVPAEVARERNRILRQLGMEKKLAFMRSFVGKKLRAITLSSRAAEFADNSTEALSDNYLTVRVRGRHASNHWIDIHVEGIEGGQLVARTFAA